ncbi:MAG: hypothetical protein H6993_14315 [Pseudomonadales bacterium]|nr:hypothetical protein [Pseudomonadales bacterium]MCP5185134.1 hypothetical protein [Pseudomonadales bacterium]
MRRCVALVARLMVLGGGALICLPAWAAETGGDQSPEARYGVLEEVVSTARKREEPLQDTPVASTVIGGEALELLFVADLKTWSFPRQT